MNLRNLKIGSRLGLAFGAICVMLVAISVLATVMMAQLNDGTSASAIVKGYMPKIEAGNSLRTTITDTDIALRNMMLNDTRPTASGRSTTSWPGARKPCASWTCSTRP
jgi:methyl-accepting chemotaxis protein